MANLPIMCTLTPAALNARREGMLSELLRRAQAHEELPQGHRLRFAATDDDSSRRSRGQSMQNASAAVSCASASQSSPMADQSS